ncbi:hypothetical protein HDU90_003097 [Geranomyces variabilis]|nr:hypothetical protein HDU90_003097 [Geranomyces variabilis]
MSAVVHHKFSVSPGTVIITPPAGDVWQIPPPDRITETLRRAEIQFHQKMDSIAMQRSETGVPESAKEVSDRQQYLARCDAAFRSDEVPSLWTWDMRVTEAKIAIRVRRNGAQENVVVRTGRGQAQGYVRLTLEDPSHKLMIRPGNQTALWAGFDARGTVQEVWIVAALISVERVTVGNAKTVATLWSFPGVVKFKDVQAARIPAPMFQPSNVMYGWPEQGPRRANFFQSLQEWASDCNIPIGSAIV